MSETDLCEGEALWVLTTPDATVSVAACLRCAQTLRREVLRVAHCELAPAPQGAVCESVRLMPPLTDRQTAALLCAYDAERERGTRAEAEVREMGLIDDGGTTPRGAAIAEEIRTQALGLWELGERAPVVTVVLFADGHRVTVERSENPAAPAEDAETAEGAPAPAKVRDLHRLFDAIDTGRLTVERRRAVAELVEVVFRLADAERLLADRSERACAERWCQVRDAVDAARTALLPREESR